MKLRNSKTEDDFREQLERSQRSLFEDARKRRLLDALRRIRPGLKSACVSSCTPDEAEEIYLVLVDGDALFSVELARDDVDAPPITEEVPMREYTRRLSRSKQVQLAVAQEVCRTRRG